jgi:hypothetical protein
MNLNIVSGWPALVSPGCECWPAKPALPSWKGSFLDRLLGGIPGLLQKVESSGPDLAVETVNFIKFLYA